MGKIVKRLSKSERAYIHPEEQAYRDSFDFQANFDGSMSFGKIGYSYCIIENTTQQVIATFSNTITAPKSSSNVAEYKAFISLLHYIDNKLQGANILILGDSKLVCDQMNNKQKINNGIYKPYAVIAKDILYNSKQKNRIVVQWIFREQNQLADVLSKCA